MRATLTLALGFLILNIGCIAQNVGESVSGPIEMAKGVTYDSSVIINGFNKNKIINEFTAVPVNDNCTNAIALTVGAACVSGTTVQATKQVGENFGCQGTPTQSVWYKFVATATSMYVEVDYTSGGCYFGSAVWSGSCLPSTNLSCVSAASAAASKTLLEVHNLTGLTVGNTYYIQVTYTSGGACGTGLVFCIDVGVPVVCNTCATVCGQVCVFSSNPSPTVAQVTASCPRYVLKPRVTTDSSRTECYTFKADSKTDSLNMVIYGHCNPNVLAFSWTLQASTCGAVQQSGSLTSGALYMTGLTIGQNYVLCYTWTAACEHDSVSPYIYSNSVPLPIKLVDFQGSFETDHVELNWATASEINNNYFTIDRSASGTDFENIGRVQGAGNSSELINYSFSDHAPLSGVSYYRLQQTDYDGKESYSSTIAINSAGKDFVYILPNPVNDKLFINANLTDRCSFLISMYNALGQQVYISSAVLDAGFNQLNVDVNKLSKGAYFLKLEYEDTIFSKLVLKE